MAALELPFPLVEAYGRRAVTLFLGAGASREAGMPMSDELAKALVERARLQDGWHPTSLDQVAQMLYLQTGFGKEWVRNSVIAIVEERHAAVGRPPSTAHSLMTRLNWRAIFTTNYDRLVEIAYDSSPDCAQRVLPIYEPDLQTRKHERAVARLIKLSGSVDEAARRASHQLVFTFAEQQEAFRRNHELFELLAEEAVNGPIVFVGFRFVHPGTKQSGTSPEYQQLLDLARRLGPAACRHYLVVPAEAHPEGDENELLRRIAQDALRDAGIDTIEATFGEFLQALASAEGTGLDAGRPRSVHVPVGASEMILSEDEANLDSRQFELLSSTLRGLQAPPVSESLNGGATWASFAAGHFIKRGHEEELAALLRGSGKQEPQLVVLDAPPGWGKSFLLRQAALGLFSESRPVLWLNPLSTVELHTSANRRVTLGAWDSTRIDTVIRKIYECAAQNRISPESIRPVIVADNCSERAHEVLRLFQEIAVGKRSFVLLFSVRSAEYDALLREFPQLHRATRFSVAGDSGGRDPITRREVESLIDLCSEHGVASLHEPAVRQMVLQRVIHDEADVSLIMALQVIFDKQHRPFSDIVRSWWSALSEGVERELVLSVAAMHRFGSIFTPRLYSLLSTFGPRDQEHAVGALRRCIASGLLVEALDDEEPCVSTLHPLVAEHIVRISGAKREEVEEAFLRIVRRMTTNARDYEVLRRMAKRVTDYDIFLSEGAADDFFTTASAITSNDWVICQQYAKHLVRRSDYGKALEWAEVALSDNPDYSPLHHTKGNVLVKWGMALSQTGHDADARRKFSLARECFALSRVRRDPDEYGYVTQLDMVSYLHGRSSDSNERANLVAEGAQLLREGLLKVPEHRFRLLGEEKYRRLFKLDADRRDALCAELRRSLDSGKTTSGASVFLAHCLHDSGRTGQAYEVLARQRRLSPTGISTWVKEAELHARDGELVEAGKCIDAARRRRGEAENAEVLWALSYWDLIVSAALEDYSQARGAASELDSSGYSFGRQSLPRGYVWRLSAKTISAERRSFHEHAKIWQGRVEPFREGGSYGHLRVTNVAGDHFYVQFNPKYFSRRDLRQGDIVPFVLTIMSDRLRADDVEGNPFTRTVDDVFVR